jgi:hypothetical protein
VKLLAMTFEMVETDDGTVTLPATVTVKMPLAEALYIAATCGKRNHPDANAIMRGGAEVNSEIYDCLVADVFNRYWDCGVTDALLARP